MRPALGWLLMAAWAVVFGPFFVVGLALRHAGQALLCVAGWGWRRVNTMMLRIASGGLRARRERRARRAAQ